MSKQNWLQTYISEQNQATKIGYILVWIMMMMFIWLLVGVGQQIDPGWQGAYLIILGGLVIIEAMVVRNLAQERSEKSPWIFWISEWIFILVGLKLAIWITQGFRGIWSEFYTWQENLENFFSGEYMTALTILIIVWFFSNSFGKKLREMHSYESDLEVGKFVQLRLERIAARQQMVNQFLFLGIIMILLATMAKMDLETLSGFLGQEMTVPLAFSVIPIIAYFVVGLILLSLTHFAILRGGWLMGEIHISQGIARNWFRFALYIFGISAIIALLLPTQFTINFLQTAVFVVQFLIEIAMFIVGLLVLPFVFLYSFIISFLPQGEPVNTNNAIPKFEMPPERTPGVLPPWIEIIQNIIFWVIFIGVIVFFVWHYLRQNQAWMKNIEFGAFGIWLEKIKLTIRNLVNKFRGQVVHSLQEIRNRVQKENQTALFENIFNKVEPEGLGPRRKIILKYTELIQQGEQSGITKKPSQTAIQYQKTLKQSLSEEQDEIDRVTQAFLEARYTRHEIKLETVEEIEPLWKRLQKSLQSFREDHKKK